MRKSADKLIYVLLGWLEKPVLFMIKPVGWIQNWRDNRAIRRAQKEYQQQQLIDPSAVH